jgi:hypothetical protein
VRPLSDGRPRPGGVPDAAINQRSYATTQRPIVTKPFATRPQATRTAATLPAGPEDFRTAVPDDNLQTMMHGDGKPRTCRLGVSEATDVTPVPACRGAVIG